MPYIDVVQELIIKKGISEKQFLKDLKLGKNSFGNWRSRGNIPDGATLNEIANYFNVSTDYLLERTSDPTPPQKKEQLTPEEQAVKKLQDEYLSLFMKLDDVGRQKLKEQAELLNLKHNKIERHKNP